MNSLVSSLAPTLAASHDLLQKMLDVSLTGIILFRPVHDPATAELVDFAFVQLNPTAQRMLNLPAHPTETFLGLYPHAAEAGVFAFYRNAFLAAQLHKDNFLYQHDGLDNYFHLSAQRSGELLLVSFTDNADQDRSAVEQALRESQAREQAARAEAERERQLLQALLAQAPVAIGLFQGEELRITAVNAHLASMWGRVPAQTLGQPLLEALPELRGQGFDDLLRQVLLTKTPVTGTEAPATMLRAGQLLTSYYNFVYQPLYDVRGEVLGVINVSAEVTEQVLARQEVEKLNQQLETRVQERTRQLELQQGLLRQILRQVPACIATLSGPEHRYTFFNEPYQQFVGERATVGATVAEVLPELVAQGFVTLLDEVYATGRPFIGSDRAVRLVNEQTGQPEERFVDFVYQPLFTHDGQPHGILAFIVDVTDKVGARRQVLNLNQELQLTNQELHAANARLIRTNTDLDTFVYTASHDLKAPIANIEGLLDTLRDYLPATTLEPMVPRLLDMMDGAVARFQQTVGHLTDVSRLQYGNSQPAEAVDLVLLVEDVRLDLDPLVAATRARLVLDVADCPVIYFSPKDLRSMVYNLLSNALKYHSPEREPVVQLRARCSETQVSLEVTDNGLGLDEQQQGKLFTLFRRLHNHVEGSGVGLYMVKRIVENAGGTITVQSRLHEGSTFLVTLPRA